MPRVTLTKAQRAHVYETHSGACCVCGNDVPPLAAWSVVEDHLLCEHCNRERRGGSLENLRAHLRDQLRAARSTVGLFGHLVRGPHVRFAGEVDGEVIDAEFEEEAAAPTVAATAE